MARVFVQRTGVDALAVAIGTVHGLYRSKPRLKFDLVEEIAQKTDSCLVLHGGSGLTNLDIQRLIAGGITKINVFTEMSIRSVERIQRNLSQHKMSIGITDVLDGVTKELCAVTSELISICGSAGRSQ
jgi:fructose/tagatose bisphosphate aldolase